MLMASVLSIFNIMNSMRARQQSQRELARIEVAAKMLADANRPEGD
jgi:hypothetical protein